MGCCRTDVDICQESVVDLDFDAEELQHATEVGSAWHAVEASSVV